MSRETALAHAGEGRVASSYQEECEMELCRGFITWMREQGCHGWWATIEIDEYFEAYCDIQGEDCLPHDRAKTLMLQVPGVRRKRTRLTGPAFKRIARATGMERATLYWIPTSRPVGGPWVARGWPVGGQGPARDQTETREGPDSGRRRNGKGAAAGGCGPTAEVHSAGDRGQTTSVPTVALRAAAARG